MKECPTNPSSRRKPGPRALKSLVVGSNPFRVIPSECEGSGQIPRSARNDTYYRNRCYSPIDSSLRRNDDNTISQSFLKSFRLLLACSALLAGCATSLKSTLVSTEARTAAYDLPATVLLPEAVLPWASKIQAELQKELLKQPQLLAPVETLSGSQLRLRMSVLETFEPKSAQLKASALMAYSAIAGVLQRQPGGVLHLVMYSADDADLEPAVRLAARRAASVQSEMEVAGLPLTRLRAEGRALPAGQPDRLELILKPVVKGYEPLAWTPPENY